MTHQEHAEKIHQTLLEVEERQKKLRRAVRKLELATARHHQALADYAHEWGGESGVSDEIMAAAAAPKNPPRNPRDT